MCTDVGHCPPVVIRLHYCRAERTRHDGGKETKLEGGVEHLYEQKSSRSEPGALLRVADANAPPYIHVASGPEGDADGAKRRKRQKEVRT